MRAVWTGSISFGLVNVPVRLYPAVSPKDPRFHQVDRETGRRVRYRRVVAEADPAEETQELSPAPADREAITPARVSCRAARGSGGTRGQVRGHRQGL